MKKVVPLFTFFLFISTINKAQDTIFKINGDSIIAKILEVNLTQIKFKKFNLLDGSVYVENKSEIKYVIYSNGLKEIFAVQEIKNDSKKDYYKKNESLVKTRKKIEFDGHHYIYDGWKIRECEMQEILMNSNDAQIYTLAQSAKGAKKKQSIGFAAIPFGIVAGGSLIFFALSSLPSYYSGGDEGSKYLIVSGIMIGGAITCPIISGIFKHKRGTYNKEAIRLYNQKY
ncbi:MAG: hypothetical protein A3F72_09875 [Bacteroidetes bacterium RIFCSPLOWO2_12_FULL_35_15]|nr:MAG: hypothetical protein A3F72_09875 [Bacteroidetes bacterium RIFCSPLOWO2_12_FULL_35_15]